MNDFMVLPYERIDDDELLKSVRLFDGERLLVLQPFGWHIDGHHIPNAAEQYSREFICEFGPYIAIVKPISAPPWPPEEA